MVWSSLGPTCLGLVLFTLGEIKNTREPIVKERKPGFRSMIWNIRKKSTRTEWRNKNSKKWGQNKKALRHLQKCQDPNHRDARKRRWTARNWKVIWKNNKRNFPSLAKEIDIQVHSGILNICLMFIYYGLSIFIIFIVNIRKHFIF